MEISDSISPLLAQFNAWDARLIFQFFSLESREDNNCARILSLMSNCIRIKTPVTKPRAWARSSATLDCWRLIDIETHKEELKIAFLIVFGILSSESSRDPREPGERNVFSESTLIFSYCASSLRCFSRGFHDLSRREAKRFAKKHKNFITFRSAARCQFHAYL